MMYYENTKEDWNVVKGMTFTQSGNNLAKESMTGLSSMKMIAA